MASEASNNNATTTAIQTFTIPDEDPRTAETLAHFEDLSWNPPTILSIGSRQIPGYENADSRSLLAFVLQQEDPQLFINSWKFATLFSIIFKILTSPQEERLNYLIVKYAQPPLSLMLQTTIQQVCQSNAHIELKVTNLADHLRELCELNQTRNVQENFFDIFSPRETAFLEDISSPSHLFEIEPFAKFQLEKSIPNYFGNPFVDVLFQLVKDFIIYTIRTLDPQDYEDYNLDGSITRVYNHFRYNNLSGLWPYPDLSSVPGHSLYLYALLYKAFDHPTNMIIEPELPLPFFESGKRLTEDRFATIIVAAARMLLAILQQNRNI